MDFNILSCFALFTNNMHFSLTAIKEEVIFQFKIEENFKHEHG